MVKYKMTAKLRIVIWATIARCHLLVELERIPTLDVLDGPADSQEPERVDGVPDELVAASDGEGQATADDVIGQIWWNRKQNPLRLNATTT